MREYSDFSLKVKRSTARRLKDIKDNNETMDSLLSRILDVFDKNIK